MYIVIRKLHPHRNTPVESEHDLREVGRPIVHDSFESAQVLAKQLAENQPGYEFIVFRAHSAYLGTVVVTDTL